MADPKPIPFPTDRRNLVRCGRAFLDLLTLRVDGGIEEERNSDHALLGDLSLDTIVCSSFAHTAEEEAAAAQFGLVPDTEQEEAAGIAADLRQRLDRAGRPGAN